MPSFQGHTVYSTKRTSCLGLKQRWNRKAKGIQNPDKGNYIGKFKSQYCCVLVCDCFLHDLKGK